ncbi:MAG TPA: SpoIIE family protein phosphatase [Candidatus Binatia bacterium]|nr:SpoIIE family protein phosphatase [Candidatus Binatia bacterium]
MTIKTQTLLMVTLLLVVAVFATAGVVVWGSRRALLAESETQGVVIARLLARSAAFGAQVTSDVEKAIGEQMIVEATIAAHLVALGEAAGVGAKEINRRLKQIADDTVLDEIWITDEKGHAYLRNNTEIDFTFSPDRERQPQAHAFWPLLTGKNKAVVQEARQREIDTQVFKYVGVGGVDKPRIVQVGYHATMLRHLQQSMGLTRLVNQLVSDGSVIAIRVLDKNMVTVDYAERLRDNKLPEPTEADFADWRNLVREGRTESSSEASLLKVVVPIGEEGGELKGGTILVTLPTDHVQAAIQNRIRLAMVVSGLVLLLGSMIAIFGAKTISRPIADLTEMTRRIAGGDFTQRIAISAKNEIGALATSFNEMTRRLNESIEHLKETTAAKERIESELQIAHDIQMSMVPKIFPPFPERSEFDIFATLVPAKEVGGDLYDFFFIDDDHLCFAVGDVSGKGVPASLFMAVTKTLFRATAGNGGSPGEILARLNTEICRDNESCMFVTFFCGILNIHTGEVHYSNAGHNLPFYLSRDGVSPLENFGGISLGLVEGSPYATGRMVLRPGDDLLLYTDGVTEAMDLAKTLYSDERLEQFLGTNRSSAPRQIIGDLVSDVRHFAGQAPQSDDITVLALRYFGATEKMTERVEVKLFNKLSELDRFNQTLTKFGRRLGLSDKVLHDLNLALEEILTNIISYGYTDSGEHEIRVRLSLQAGEVKAEVEDDGQPFNPLDVPEPDTAKLLDERTIGGLGIHLVRKIVDALEYKRQGESNLLTIKKKTQKA